MLEEKMSNNQDINHLSQIAEIIMGQSPPSSTYNNAGDGLPFFQGKAEFGKRHPTIKKYCSKPKKLAKKGDILMSVRAPVGAVNIANVDCCIGRGLCAIRPKENMDTLYVYHYLRLKEKEIAHKGLGSTFKAISKRDVQEFEIPILPLSIQRQIVSILEKAEKLKAKREQANEKTNQMLQSVFLDMFGTPFINEKEWRMVQIGDILTECQYGSSQKSSDSGYPILGMSSMNYDGTSDFSKHSYVELGDVDFRKYRLQKGDILFNMFMA